MPDQSDNTDATDTTSGLTSSHSVTNTQTRPFLLQPRPGPRLQITTKWPSSTGTLDVPKSTRSSGSTVSSSRSRTPASGLDTYRGPNSQFGSGQTPESARSSHSFSSISSVILTPASTVPPPEYLALASPDSFFGLSEFETRPWDDNKVESYLAKAEQALCELRTELMFYYQRKLTKGNIPQFTKKSYEMRNEEHARAIGNYMTVGMNGHSAYSKEDTIALEVTSNCTTIAASELVPSEINIDVCNSACDLQSGDYDPLEHSRSATPEDDIPPIKLAKTRPPVVPPRPVQTTRRSGRRARSPPPPTSSSISDTPPPVPPLVQRNPPIIPPRPLKRNITTPNPPVHLASKFSTTEKQFQGLTSTTTIAAPYTSTLETRYSLANRSAIHNQETLVPSPPKFLLNGPESTRNATLARFITFSALREAFDKGGPLTSKKN